MIIKEQRNMLMLNENYDFPKKKLMKIVDKRRKNRKYAPRTMLIDGEIYEVYLLAIA